MYCRLVFGQQQLFGLARIRGRGRCWCVDGSDRATRHDEAAGGTVWVAQPRREPPHSLPCFPRETPLSLPHYLGQNCSLSPQEVFCEQYEKAANVRCMLPAPVAVRVVPPPLAPVHLSLTFSYPQRCYASSTSGKSPACDLLPFSCPIPPEVLRKKYDKAADVWSLLPGSPCAHHAYAPAFG